MNPFPDPLLLEDVETRNGTQVFKLTAPFTYISKKHGKLTVPTGFETDGVSSPRIIWPLIGPTSKAFKISIFHDYVFSKVCKYNFTRKEADDLMLEGMIDLEVPLIERRIVYRALRLFSWMFWKKN